MEPTTRRDDELAQQAPLVPDLGRADEPRMDGGRTDGETPSVTRTLASDAATQRTYDDELAQEAPLVPDLGRAARTTDDSTSQ